MLNRVAQFTATTGQGTITLGARVPGFFTMPEAGAVNGTQYPFVLQDGTNIELFFGTYNSGAGTVTRDTVRASLIAGVAGTTKLTLTGNAQVSVDVFAEHLTTDWTL